MANKKTKCTDCCTYTITFTNENCKKILTTQATLLFEGKRRSIQQVVNNLIKEK